MRHAARTDENQQPIIDALRAVGCHVVVIGWPVDLLVSRAGRFYPIEVKRPEIAHQPSALTNDQREFIADAKATVHVVSTVTEALRAVGL